LFYFVVIATICFLVNNDVYTEASSEKVVYLYVSACECYWSGTERGNSWWAAAELSALLYCGGIGVWT